MTYPNMFNFIWLMPVSVGYQLLDPTVFISVYFCGSMCVFHA